MQEPNKVPCPSPDGWCDLGLADLIVNQVAVEQQNTVTNPLLNAWQDSAHKEATDECRNFFAPATGAAVPNDASGAGNLANQNLNGRGYYLNTAFNLAAIRLPYPGVPCILGDRLNFTLKDLVPRAEIVPTLAALFAHFKSDRWPGESFGDYCHRLGAEAVRALLPSGDETTSEGDGDGGDAGRGTHPHAGPKRHDGPGGAEAVGVLVGEKVQAAVGAVERRHSNGDAPRAVFLGAAPALTEPRTESIAVALAEPQVAAVEPKTTSQRNETHWTGPHGEELRDFSVHFDNNGQVRETVVYFYGDDLRAAQARLGEPLCREAVYVGRVDPQRLHAARKRSDTLYVGAATEERADVRREYYGDGTLARTVVSFGEYCLSLVSIQ